MMMTWTAWNVDCLITINSSPACYIGRNEWVILHTPNTKMALHSFQWKLSFGVYPERSRQSFSCFVVHRACYLSGWARWQHACQTDFLLAPSMHEWQTIYSDMTLWNVGVSFFNIIKLTVLREHIKVTIKRTFVKCCFKTSKFMSLFHHCLHL